MNGLLVLDKPAGMTSHDVVAIVRRATGEKSIGHLGTLDPMATGVLPLLLGKYTRLAQFFGQAEKVYRGTIRFGWATDSFDADGAVTGPARPLTRSFEELLTLARRFDGEMDQMPPIFSAKKINGVPAHKLARAGVEVPVRAARIRIHSFALTGIASDGGSQRGADGEPVADLVQFTLHVSAGGYVRSVAHELGQDAGCGAHLASLQRVQAGPFTLADSVMVEQLKAISGNGSGAEMDGLLPHPRTLLPEMPAVTVDERIAGRIRNGMQVNLPEFSHAPLIKVFTGPTELLAVARRVAGTLAQPIVVLG